MSLEINTEDFWKEIDKRVVEHRIEKKLMREEITKLREQVAAQAAVIEKLLKCLRASVAGLEFRKQHLMRGISDALYEDRMEAAIDKIKEALAIPTNSTQILDEVRRAERERCAKVMDNRYVDLFEPEIKEAAAAIRAME